MSKDCARLRDELRSLFSPEQLIDDPLRTLAHASDASFYRLIPGLVVKVRDEADVAALLAAAGRHLLPVTFRAAGTSLSGQAVTDSVLALLDGEHWREARVLDDGAAIRLQPGVIGADANRCLAPYGRKIGPDPASINACKIGGIAANNASGMCCGTAQNSYNTMQAMRVLLADGSVLDTADRESVAAFRARRADLLDALAQLARQVRADGALAQRIRHKFRIKNTTGYGLNALLDFDDPIDMLSHLMIGSEGTLGFISSITYRSVPDYPHKATALVLFADLESACRAVVALRPEPVDAVELMDRAALRAVQDKSGMPPELKALGPAAAALLIDVRGEDEASLQRRVAQVSAVIETRSPLRAAAFVYDAVSYQRLWNVRKGLFPAVGAVRAAGTTVIIEDVAVPIADLAPACLDLQRLFARHGYHEAIIFGHALEGNVHFVFTQEFGDDAEVARYAAFMEDVAGLIADRYGGSLKAEHGTGRNMAPFVEREWGADAYAVMRAIKQLFDPAGLLNPGVLLNEDPEVHLRDLKPMPATDALIDRCIECGFCEAVCPSRNLTLTPRQRIVSLRRLAQLRGPGDVRARERLEAEFAYPGIDTCAADGLCADRCPVGIDTGAMIRALRGRRASATARKVAGVAQRHFAAAARLTRLGLGATELARRALGPARLGTLSQGLHRLGVAPVWHTAWPKPAATLTPRRVGQAERVVFFPSCAARTMGPDALDSEQRSLHQLMRDLIEKAGLEAVIPGEVAQHCCGKPFDSRGLDDAAEAAAAALEALLWEASDGGRLPILCDASPCTLRMTEQFRRPLALYEPARLIRELLLPRLTIARRLERVALHLSCSTRKLGLDSTMLELVRLFADEVIVPDTPGCCGFAGDKGFSTPELNASALAGLKPQVAGCVAGISNSRTCEIGLTRHGGIPYRSVAWLVDHCCERA